MSKRGTGTIDVLYGINAVTEAIGRRPMEHVLVAEGQHGGRIQEIIEACRAAGVSIRFAPRPALERTAGTAQHQNVVAVCSPRNYDDLEALLRPEGAAAEPPLLVVLDGVEDPANLGAVVRTTVAAGASGILIPERRAAGITPAVARVSAGASEHLSIAKVTNIARTLEELKQQNIWTVGLESANAGGGGGAPYDSLDYKMDCALVLGAEGKGLHDLVSKRCDFLVFIPMLGKVSSLNVSVAAGIVMYEVVRQRRRAAEMRKR